MSNTSQTNTNISARNKVFVGLSGGVDSAVCAALLGREGYEVAGVFIKIQITGYPCPAKEDRLSAMRVAAHLRIPFIEIDLSKEYEREVFRTSISEFEEGKTPNPDTLCNKKIKFGAFYEFARSRGADYIATGHYARVAQGSTLTPGLSRSNLGQVEDFLEEAGKVIEHGGRIMVTTLTKKMAEDLTEFLKDKKIKAAYLHSDVETL